MRKPFAHGGSKPRAESQQPDACRVAGRRPSRSLTRAESRARRPSSSSLTRAESRARRRYQPARRMAARSAAMLYKLPNAHTNPSEPASSQALATASSKSRAS